jgi:hypothetical protein
MITEYIMLNNARIYAAKVNRECAKHAFDPDYGFASHITDKDKQDYADKELKLAEEIENGLHDNNFTVWQRMNYFLTGDCVALLP